jgi:hypothetical protein
MDLKWSKKGTKIDQKGIPKTDPQKDHKKLTFSFHSAIAGSLKTMVLLSKTMVFQVLAFSLLFPSEGRKNTKKASEMEPEFT